jgi:hypothetical protein
MDYVTYAPDGKLTGGYQQDLHPSHDGAYIEVSEDIRKKWVLYRANAARNGVELAPVDQPTAGQIAETARVEAKRIRQAAVDAITVTVGDKTFDGDEVSQGRMARALLTASITGQTSCTWVLHDNTSAIVTKEELEMALALSMQAQAAVWVI